MADKETLGLIGGVLVVLIATTAIVFVLRRRTDSHFDTAIVETFWGRVRAWWLLFTVLAATFLIGQTATIVLFGLISFWALREFITLTPTRPGDHRALFWVFFLFTPLQFVLVGMNQYDLYSILIPVYAFLFILARVAMSGDSKRFLERTAKIQAGLLVCVYCFSYAPALLTFTVPERPADAMSRDERPADLHLVDATPDASQLQESLLAPIGLSRGDRARLLFFFVLMVQLSDALQFAWSRIPSRHVIVPTISPNRTWEGLLGGTASVTLLGTALCFATPFSWWQAASTSVVIALMGFAGGLTMSAIKRDRGVKDYGTLVEGHGGVLDRIDSICFAAPVFFHMARFFLS